MNSIDDFDYILPVDRIAQRPLGDRDGSRMLLLDRKTGELHDNWFRNLPHLLHGDELLVVNNARVIPARLFAHREGVKAQISDRAR
ncbi:MAG: S-adenosylmethionine:tRNA ribosyltransferase-isomerase, partial [Anaerolineales bacterium]